jgi:glycine/D-amino acid oxidase-like deaminating enzyme/nitrite reductase/ring-hydroxylating ferredoxin subunit
MSVRSAPGGSVWVETGPDQPELPEIDGEVHADVAVLGGGIVGITTALLLAEAGVRVVLMEANQLARGVSGYTTAKVSSQHGMIYSQLRSRFGSGGAAAYGAANEAALDWIARRVDSDGIDCDFRRRAAYAYGSRPQVEDEVRAAAEAGLPASLAESTPLPFPVEAAVRFDDQAEFHPRKYLLALGERLQAAGVEVYERSHAVEVSTDEDCLVKSPGGRVKADRVVVATHFPFLDRSFAFARVHPERSYALVCRIAGEPPEGMFISGGSPTRSLRAVPVGGEELLLVGGEGHRTGEGGDTTERYAALERFAREHWDVESIEYRWSAQDNITIDSVPYVGQITPRNDRVLMATGFAKWGMTGGTAAAMMLADRLLGRENAWAGLFDPNRVKPRAALGDFVTSNAKVAAHFFGDRVTKRGERAIEDLAPGEGDIVRLGDEKVAGYRDDEGTLMAVSPVCSHLGCQVNWNSAERSWDCPCHGSRFTPRGDVLQGPAVHRLEQKPIA